MSISKRQQEERKDRKEKILNGALDVFKKHGIENSTMEEIALNAGFGTATIYYYFHSKEEIFSEILINGWQNLWKKIEPIVAIKYNSPRKVFVDVLLTISKIIRNNTSMYNFLFNVPNQMNFNNEPWKKYQNKLYQTLIALLKESIDKGEFPPIDHNILFKALGGLFMGVVLMGNQNKPISGVDIDKLIEQIISNPTEN